MYTYKVRFFDFERCDISVIDYSIPREEMEYVYNEVNSFTKKKHVFMKEFLHLLKLEN